MINWFYQRFSKHLVGMVLLTQLPLIWVALNIKTNNDTETWMPETTPARQQYEEFKRAFGAEEFLLIAFDTSQLILKLSHLRIHGARNRSTRGQLLSLPTIENVRSRNT